MSFETPKLQACYDKLGTEQTKIYQEINRIQKQLDYWEQYYAETTRLKIIEYYQKENEKR